MDAQLKEGKYKKMKKEQARAEVMGRLATQGIVRMDDTMIIRKVVPSHMSGDDLVIYQIYTSDGDVHDYCQEDLLIAVNDFLNMNEKIWAKKEKRQITVDAETLRQQNYRAAEAAYSQWCEENNQALAETEDQILAANDAGLRTMDIDVPREDSENFCRFFRERHFEVHCQEYSSENTEKVGKALLRIEWSGKPKTHKVSPKAPMPGEGCIIAVEDLTSRGGIEDFFRHLFR